MRRRWSAVTVEAKTRLEIDLRVLGERDAGGQWESSRKDGAANSLTLTAAAPIRSLLFGLMHPPRMAIPRAFDRMAVSALLVLIFLRWRNPLIGYCLEYGFECSRT